MNIYDKIAGGLFGLLVGDALGVPYEFHMANELPSYEEIEMTPPPGFRRTYASVAPGTWSDDGAQALCLFNSLLDCDGFSLEDFARKLLSLDTYIKDYTVHRAITVFIRQDGQGRIFSAASGRAAAMWWTACAVHLWYWDRRTAMRTPSNGLSCWGMTLIPLPV